MPKKRPQDCYHQESLFCEDNQDVALEQSIYPALFGPAGDQADKLVCCKRNGLLFEADSIPWLKTIRNGTVDLIFADPPCPIKKADRDKYAVQEAYIAWSMEWIQEAARILKPSGTLLICGFSELLADLKHPAMKHFRSCRWLIWYYKNKANLGRDWGRSHESILLLRKGRNFTMNLDAVRIAYNEHTLKYPLHPQAETSQYGGGKNQETWQPHPLGAKPKDVIEIPTTCNGMEEKTKHPTQKPEELLRRLLLSASNPGDVILDPFSGSGTTMVAAEQLNRRWIGCEIRSDYNQWAMERLNQVEHRTEEEWIAFDKENAKRRSSIR